MKKTRLYNPLLVAAVFSTFFAHTAMASDGTITFNGKITANTCTVKLDNNGTGTGSVTLPTISINALPSNNSVAGTTQFKINLSGCSITEGASVSTYFEPGATVNAAGRLSNSTGSSSGIDIQLLNADYAIIDASKPSSSQNDKKVAMAVSDTSAALTYYAQYHSNGAPTAGTLITQVNYTVAYD